MSRTRKRYNRYILNNDNARFYKVGIYARVSVDNKDNSIGNQIEIAKEYIAKNRDLKLIDIYIDNGVSGKNFFRKGYEKLTQDINQKKINCIIVKDISRLGRNFIELSQILEYEMITKNVRVISINDDYDSKNCSPQNIIIKNMINEIYIRDTSYKIKKSKEHLKKSGAYIGVCTPYGYKIEKKNGVRKLAVDDKTHKIVEKICQLYEKSHSYTYIRKWLYIHNINTKMDYKKNNHIYAKDNGNLKMWSIKSIKETIEHENCYLQ